MIDLTRPVADLVSDYPETARILQRHRIDYCCRGHQPLAEACADRGADAQIVRAECEGAIAERRGPRPIDARALATPELIAMIVDRHHGYLRRTLPFVLPLAAKVARRHGENDPRLVELYQLVRALTDALEPHLAREEEVLFPALVASTLTPEAIAELEDMKREHLEVGDLLYKMRKLTSDFEMPDWACNSYRTLFAELVSLEGDILTHVHIENHVLVPRVLGGQAA